MNNIFNEWTQLLHSPKFTACEKVVLGIILDYTNLKENKKWNNITLQNLVNETTLNPKTVRKVLNNLERNCFIKKNTNVYKSANDYVPNIASIRNIVNEVKLTHTNEVKLTHNAKPTKQIKPITTKLRTLNRTNTPLQQTAENQTDGDENSNTQNEAIHNTNERTSGKRNEGFRHLDNGDRDNNTNSDKPKPNNQTAENQTDGYENSNNVDKANHNSNEHGIGNPSESFDEFELRLAMQSEGITQPEVDIYQIPDIPNEPNEDILQQAYDWFNGNGDYDPISLPNEEPITPKNASEGLKATETNNYTKANGNALKTAEKPQKSNCAAESTNVRDNNTPQNGNNTPKNAPTSAQNFQWVLQPTKGCDWRSVKIAIENLRPSETRRTQSLQPLIDGVYNKYRVIETLQMTKEHCISWRQKANFHVVANVYWRAIVWYSDQNTGYTKSQIEFVYNLLSDINKLIREYDTYKVSNTVYMAFKTAGNNLKPMLPKPKIAA